jgi:hypothetical protein
MEQQRDRARRLRCSFLRSVHHPIAYRSPTLRHRPRRNGSVWLAQEVEERCCTRSRLIKTFDRIWMDRRARRSFCFQGCDEACRRGCPSVGSITLVIVPRFHRRDIVNAIKSGPLSPRECGPDLLSPSPDSPRRLGPTLSQANCGRIPSEIVAVSRRLTEQRWAKAGLSRR